MQFWLHAVMISRLLYGVKVRVLAFKSSNKNLYSSKSNLSIKIKRAIKLLLKTYKSNGRNKHFGF